jgi:hypothetical protein
LYDFYRGVRSSHPLRTSQGKCKYVFYGIPLQVLVNQCNFGMWKGNPHLLEGEKFSGGVRTSQGKCKYVFYGVPLQVLVNQCKFGMWKGNPHLLEGEKFSGGGENFSG